ncbi:methyl-accepting chemotaxis protein [Neorhodopirellula pilleata]|uniref:Biofilm dispersion protein BdlA n=1 Tax=Neorhodopirellula pilleata TaxID=2714738 RepID=A0A5C6A310_9BACT|nr:PAS domain-containing methyl-accepting chemotaxis protein [Neorhodopirellula pilleata]TWT93717.1 Biofilm dispersion protein BdlA [Neorhodopirellula pilleata]
MLTLKSKSNDRVDSLNEEIHSLRQELQEEQQKRRNLNQVFESIQSSQAVIEFEPDGTIIHANENFLRAVGYTLDEIAGRHHRMFVDETYARSPGYQTFWTELKNGQFKSSEYKRFGKGGREIWLQAIYTPVLDESGTVQRVIKLANDITQVKHHEQEIRDRTQAVIEFTPNGTIIDANSMFLTTIGYSIDQIRGQHHSMFMPKGEATTPEYRKFWEDLANGTFHQGEFRRIDSRGNELWLYGAYSPSFDLNGNVVGVIKRVSNITDQVNSKRQAREAGGSVAMGVREMSQAISEISERITRTATLARDSECLSSRTADEVKNLAESSRCISKVVDLIQDLADQTNLLALNATIEAARAGEAGRGFSVVATEVKALANQTGVATNDIRKSVEAIQFNVDTVVKGIDAISNGISEVSANTDSVASSVEEQSIVMTGLSSSAELLLAMH